jgi:hypothetical protein
MAVLAGYPRLAVLQPGKSWVARARPGHDEERMACSPGRAYDSRLFIPMHMCPGHLRTNGRCSDGRHEAGHDDKEKSCLPRPLILDRFKYWAADFMTPEFQSGSAARQPIRQP